MLAEPNASAVPTSIEVEGLLARRHAERNVAMVAKEAAEHTAVAPSCVAGPIAYGFDRPGGGPFDSMKYDGKKCSGVGMINTTGCNAQACAARERATTPRLYTTDQLIGLGDNSLFWFVVELALVSGDCIVT